MTCPEHAESTDDRQASIELMQVVEQNVVRFCANHWTSSGAEAEMKSCSSHAMLEFLYPAE
jgi:hypothetical protein